METTNQKSVPANMTQEAPVAPQVNPDAEQESLSPVKMTPVMKIGLIVLGVLVLLLILSAVFLKKPAPTPTLSPSPLPTTTASMSAEPRPVSAFAKTEQFTTFESSLQKLRVDLDTLDLSESQLAYPLIDTDVNFTK